MTPGTLPYDRKLVIYRDTADSLTLAFTDPNGDPMDLSGKTFTAQVRRRKKGDSVLNMVVTATDLAGGLITVSWTKALTADIPIGPATWGLADSDDLLWIEDTCTLSLKTPDT